MRPLPPLIDTVAQIVNAAETLGLQGAAATGHYLLSILHQEAGDTPRAETSTLRAAAAGRDADETTRAHQLANTARCLLELETEIGRSRELIREAGGNLTSLGLELCELHWAQGLLQRWDGEAEGAIASITRALALARKDEDRWREYKCLTWLAMLEQELGRYDEMKARCEELTTVAARLGEDETPFVATLQGLALLAAEETSASDVLADALGRLRTVDDKSYLAYALNSAARLHLRAGRIDQVRLCATEALDAASAMRRRNEVTIARAMLAQAGETGSVPDIESGVAAPSDRNSLSARARSTLLE
jgi:tetratricopeptide (TPR) repeat protein